MPAIPGAEARVELERLAAEQAALRRVATLVAQGVAPSVVFKAVTAEIAELFGLPLVGLVRYGSDGTATAIASTSDFCDFVGRSWSLRPDDSSVLATVLRTGQPARIDDYAGVPPRGSPAETAREIGVSSSVGAPIIVDGRTWGAAVFAVQGDRPPLPVDTVDRLTDFTDLIATAIANAEARNARGQLTEMQSALRRVATLAAAGAPRLKVFEAVAEEVGRLLAVDHAYVTSIDDDRSVTVLAGWISTGQTVPSELPRRLDTGPIAERLRESGGPVRLDP